MAFKMKYKKGGFPFKETIAKRNFDKEMNVDPDAPGTPGEPGYEPPVKYEDLDEKGKKIWNDLRKKEFKNTGEVQPGVEQHLHTALIKDLENKKKK